ncbi:MAG: transposase [Lachnospiraceae bacterium]|nr:transposase [Lachnospiraceae bacterium]
MVLAKYINNYLVIIELYRQQKYMFDNKVKRVENRIVSINQPFIRPIVRGKVKAPTEFEAKYDVSLDQIYHTRDNREFCKKHGIEMSGPKLGRPKKDEKKTKLDTTTLTSIALSVLAANVFRADMGSFLYFIWWIHQKTMERPI